MTSFIMWKAGVKNRIFNSLIFIGVASCTSSCDSQTDDLQTITAQAGDAQTSQLSPGDPKYLQGSRGAMALSGHTVMQMTFDDGNQYTVFEQNGTGDWPSQQTIRIEGRLQQSALIAMDGDTAVFSFRQSQYEIDDENLTTAAYVYLRDDTGLWQAETILDQHYVDSRADIAISGDTIAISSTTEVFVYSRDSAGSWSLQANLESRDAASMPDRSFISLNDGTLVTGSSENGEGVVVYDRDSSGTWAQNTTLPIEGVVTDIAHHGNTIIIGADPATNFYSRDNNGSWREVASFEPGLSSVTNYGSSVAVFENQAIVSSYEMLFFYQRDENGMWNESSRDAQALNGEWIFLVNDGLAVNNSHAVFTGNGPNLATYVIDFL